MKTKLVLLAVLLAVGISIYTREPEKLEMTHIVFWYKDFKFAGQKYQDVQLNLWLAGNRYMRAEEVSHAQRVPHDVNIVARADMYRLNSAKKTGQHSLNPDPSHEIYYPIAPVMFRQGLEELRFGSEVEFFEKRKAQKRAMTRGDSEHYQEYVLKEGPATVTLLVHDATGLPAELFLERGKDTLRIMYDTYESGLEPDLSLFAVAPEMKLTEARW